MTRRRRYVVNSNNNDPLIDSTKDDDFDENVSYFLSHLKMKGRSVYTILYYKRELRKFMVTLEEGGVATRLRRLTSDIIMDEYVMYVSEEKGARHASIAATLRALKAFLNWAISRGIISQNPMNDVPIGKVKPKTIETFTRDQIRNLLAQPDRELFIGLRDYTIMVTLLETGIRVRELADIKMNDVRFSDNQILIRGKNGDDRLVPFQTQTRRVLRDYIKARGQADVDYLFITHDDKQMNRDSVRRRTIKYGRMAGIDNIRCSPHTFRHTFAKMSVKNGADLFALQQILGHKSLDMVRVYVNLFSDEVSDAHAKFSPIEGLIRR